jgi:hypothetical protein
MLVDFISDKSSPKRLTFDPDQELFLIKEDLFDIIPIIQIRGDIHHTTAKEINIIPDFKHAFSLLLETIQQFIWPHAHNSTLITDIRKRFIHLYLQTFG